MEWGRVKSIMIGVFFIVNVFLFISYIGTMKTGTAISEETIKNTVAILAQNNIEIDNRIIPNKTQDVRIFDVVNEFETPQSAATHYWSIAQNEGLDCFNPEKTTTIGNSFEYKSTNSSESYNFTQSTALSFAKRIVSKLGLDNSLPLESKVAQNDEGYIVAFNQAVEGSLVLDSILVVELGKSGVTRIYGKNWLGDELKGGGLSSIRPITEILVNYAISKQREKKTTITDAQLGYFLGDRNGVISTVTVVPVWMLKTDLEGTIYYDARNGDLLE